MHEVKRYELYRDKIGWPIMKEMSDGDYVSFSDYQNLEKENAEYKLIIEPDNSFNDHWEYQKEENFFKEENNSLEFKKYLARYFYSAGVTHCLGEINTLRANINSDELISRSLHESRMSQVEKELDAEKEKHEFTKQYLNPVDTSFRIMMDGFRSLPKDKQDQLIDLSRALLAIKDGDL